MRPWPPTGCCVRPEELRKQCLGGAGSVHPVSPLFSVSAQPLVLAGVIMDFLNTRGFPESWRRGFSPGEGDRWATGFPISPRTWGAKVAHPTLSWKPPTHPTHQGWSRSLDPQGQDGVASESWGRSRRGRPGGSRPPGLSSRPAASAPHVWARGQGPWGQAAAPAWPSWLWCCPRGCQQRGQDHRKP